MSVLNTLKRAALTLGFVSAGYGHTAPQQPSELFINEARVDRSIEGQALAEIYKQLPKSVQKSTAVLLQTLVNNTPHKAKYFRMQRAAHKHFKRALEHCAFEEAAQAVLIMNTIGNWAQNDVTSMKDIRQFMSSQIFKGSPRQQELMSLAP